MAQDEPRDELEILEAELSELLLSKGSAACRRILEERGCKKRDAALLEAMLRTAINKRRSGAGSARAFEEYEDFLRDQAAERSVVSVVTQRWAVWMSSPPAERSEVAKRPEVKGTAAKSAFEWAGLLTPRRIRVEDIGDAQEELDRLVAHGASRARITAYVVAQLFYIGVNTSGYLVKKLSPFFGGKSTGS